MKLLVLISMLLMSVSIFADDKSSGCGLGWSVTKRTSLLSSLVRSSTNATFSSTSGMTSGTSGCAQHSIVMNEKRGIHFMEVNRPQLMVEAASGGGEFVEGFAHTVGYTGDMSTFGTILKDNYQVIFTKDASAVEVYNNFKKVVISLDETV